MENLKKKKFDEIMNDVKTNGKASKYFKMGATAVCGGCIDFSSMKDVLELDVYLWFHNKTIIYNLHQKIVYIGYKKEGRDLLRMDDEFSPFYSDFDAMGDDKFIGLVHFLLE